MLDLQQLRARRAFAIAQADNDTKTDTFVALARQLPLMLRINGFLATWAHLCAKDEPHHRRMLLVLDQHLVERSVLDKAAVNSNARDRYCAWVGNGEHNNEPISSVRLRQLTEESLAFSGWLKRAVDACSTGD